MMSDSADQRIFEATQESPDTEQRLAIVQFFEHLLALNMVSQIILTDRNGKLILSTFDFREENNQYYNPLLHEESGVVVSASKLFDALEGLRQKKPACIHAQFHNAIVVQVMEYGVLLTVIGERSKGHFIGGLLSATEKIRTSAVFIDAAKNIEPFVTQ